MQGAAGAAAPVQVTPGGDVTLNFTDADIHEVVRAVVGDILGLNYSIDSKVQGTVTVRTMRPLPRAAVLPTLGRVLRANGAALIEDDGMVRVTPLEAGAAKGAAAPQGGGALQTEAGTGVRVVPLQYVGAAQIQKLLEPFTPAGAVIQTDAVHNILVLSGTREDMAALSDLVRSFDVDWLQRMSFAMVPLRSSTAQTIVTEMQAIIAGAAGGVEGAADALRLVPLERLNAVLVITAQPRYLDWARQQIATLDAGSVDGVERTYIYHVQFGRASDLADVLTRVFGGGTGAAGGAAAASRTSSSSSSELPAGGRVRQRQRTASVRPCPRPCGHLGGERAAAQAGSAASPPPLSNALAPRPRAATPARHCRLLPSTGSPRRPPPHPPPPSAPPGEQPSATRRATPIRIVTDERNNALVIATTARQYRRIEETLRRLDVKPMQVVIEATIAEVTLNDELQFGLQWFFRNHSGTNSATFTNVATNGIAIGLPGFYVLSESERRRGARRAVLDHPCECRVLAAAPGAQQRHGTASGRATGAVPVQQQQASLTPKHRSSTRSAISTQV